MTPQILVVGAGPVGLTMALELARYGVAVRIVEKAAQRTDKSKALVIWARTLELLDRSGPTDGFVAAGNKVVAANILTANTPIARIDLTNIDSAYPFALMLAQSETERLLDERLAGFGITVERQVELLQFSQSETGVTSVLRHIDGREETLETDWLVGCDGAHSTVRHALGLRFDGDTLPADFILADVHLRGLKIPFTELPMYWHHEGVLAMFPISVDRYRVIADIGRSTGTHPPEPTLEEVRTIVERRGPGGLVLSDPVWLSGFRINERKVRDYRVGRVFVTGDAAHVHSPAGGQGMNTGMQDAFNLAWKLALACHGTCRPEKLLGSYSPERSAVGDLVLANAGRLTALATLKNPVMQTVRNALASVVFGLGPVRRAMAENFGEVSIGYPHSPLNGPHPHGVGGLMPGERVPPRAGETPIGAGNIPRFALFAETGKATTRLLQDFPDLLETSLRPPLRDGGMWLARPDGYVAMAARDADVDAIADYLKTIG